MNLDCLITVDDTSNDLKKDTTKAELSEIPAEFRQNPGRCASTLYDLVAEGADKSNLAQYEHFSYKNELKQFISLMPKGGVIIDLGCGLGFEVTYFAKLGFEAYGLDISEKSIELARELFPHLNFIKGDFSDFTIYEKLKVDGIHEHLSLMNLPKEDIERLLERFYSLSKNGGLLQVSFEEDIPEKTGWYAVPVSKTVKWKEKLVRVGGFIHFSYYTYDELKKTIQQSGFNILSVSSYFEKGLSRKTLTILCQKKRNYLQGLYLKIKEEVKRFFED